MPFVQRENISLFVRACQSPPLSLPDHDIFLTDDLYEGKDPAQVLQCIAAFSRRASAVNPAAFPRAIGGKSKSSLISPQPSGKAQASSRNTSNAVNSPPVAWNPLAKGSYARDISPTKTSVSVSPPHSAVGSNQKAAHGTAAPAWDIHQYGYMGGASQGNQGVAFGARRQITSAVPSIPTLAEKERRREEEERQATDQRLEAQEAERLERLELEAAEERARVEEEERWREETRRRREEDQAKAEAEAKAAAEHERRRQELLELEVQEVRGPHQEHERSEQKAGQARTATSEPRSQLPAHFLSQYQSQRNGQSHDIQANTSLPRTSSSESDRIRDLERQLAQARERERQYRLQQEQSREGQHNHSVIHLQSEEYGAAGEGNDRAELNPRPMKNEPSETLESSFPMQRPPSQSSMSSKTQSSISESSRLGEANDRVKKEPRPLPNPATYTSNMNRTERYLVDNPMPATNAPQSHRPADYSTTTEVDLENKRRHDSQAKTKAGGWASKSLLEREMEKERERQREWEEAQKKTAQTPRDVREGSGPGQSWNVHQYGYVGGDNQNRGGPGLGVDGARRQIIGPRPQR